MCCPLYSTKQGRTVRLTSYYVSSGLWLQSIGYRLQCIAYRLQISDLDGFFKSLLKEFFTFFVIFLNLCINTRLARLYIILMAFAFYCVGCAKAFLCLPRPRLPLVKPLESALDWALPSNHAVMATCLPLYVWFYSYLHQAQLGLTSGTRLQKKGQLLQRAAHQTETFISF